MDNFFKGDNVEFFKKWAYNQIQSNKDFDLVKKNDNSYEIFYKNKIAKFIVWPNNIIEESIEENDDLIFYLHYEFYNFTYATDLFNRMIDILLLENRNKTRKILLCCSGGMTTGYFATRANQFCKLNQLPYEIDANSIERSLNIYQNYDIILLAPQVHYRARELRDILPDIKIILIDPSTFASYDCAKLVKLIEDNID